MASNPRTADDACSYFRSEEQRCQSDDRGQMHCELLKRVWGYKAGIATRTVDTHVLTVRKKLGDNAQQPRFIETLHGVGYQFIGHPDG